MLGAAADGLHGSPHVAVFRQQIPARRFELVRLDSSAFVYLLSRADGMIPERLSPGHVSIPSDDGVRAA